MELPDVLGWELAAAWEECGGRRGKVCLETVLDPLDARVDGSELVEVLSKEEELPDSWRVVQVKPAEGERVTLVVCREEWQPLKFRRSRG